MIQLTAFKNIYDNKIDKNVSYRNWDSFLSQLLKLSKVSYASKKDAFLISPAVYNDDSSRANKNVKGWGKWAALDIDDYDESSDSILELVKKKYSEYNYCCYSTASSTKSHAKFRIVFELDRFVDADEIRHFWFALNTTFNSMGDKQVKDFSRMYYAPGTYANANNFFFSGSGKSLNVTELMKSCHYVEKSKGKTLFDRLPPEYQEMIVQQRKDQLENRRITWSNYKDCPFVNKKMISEYNSLSKAGWYSKMYSLMVSIAALAIMKKYPISPKEIEILCRQIDKDTGNWYEKRPLELEASRAIEYVYRNN
jgi:hypothetical protein